MDLSAKNLLQRLIELNKEYKVIEQRIEDDDYDDYTEMNSHLGYLDGKMEIIKELLQDRHDKILTETLSALANTLPPQRYEQWMGFQETVPNYDTLDKVNGIMHFIQTGDLPR